MRAIVKCENCGEAISVGNGRVNLVCQKCGTYDLRFDRKVRVAPVFVDATLGPTIDVFMNDTFYSLHGVGSIWEVEIDESVIPETPPVVEEVGEGEPQKPSLVKPIKKLRRKIGDQ